MGFLDNIGQRTSGPQSHTPAPIVDPPLSWDPTPAGGSRSSDEAPRSNRVHAAAVWIGVLIVVAAVAVAAWMGARRLMNAAPSAQAAADTAAEVQEPTATATPAAKPTPPRAAIRHVATRKNRAPVESASSNAGPEVTGDAFAAAPTNETADETSNVSAGNTALTDTAADPVPAAMRSVPPEDDSVYSTDASDIVAPRLVSLGFTSRPLNGFTVRTSRLELIISKSGTVERARIFSPSMNWDDAMLLSRAKTFQFVPALRNGSPVRFRYVMEVDVAP